MQSPVRFELVEMSGWSKVVLSPDPVTSLAHCVSADFDMTDGIANKFRKKYGTYEDLIRKGYIKFPFVVIFTFSGG